jgi:TolB protein
MRFRLGIKGAAVVTAVLAAAATGAGVALAVPSAHPAKAPSSLVPLRQVGLGWSIVEYSAAKVPPHATKGKTTLYAVSPTGRKFPFFSWPAAKPSLSTFFLVDWSGDGQRVLVANGYNKFEQISLATGQIVNSFKLPSSASALAYTRPHGENILASFGVGGIRRYDLNGNLTKVLTKSGEGAIESPDGTSVIVGTSYGVEQVSNAGGVIKRLHTPVAVFGCGPDRWWNATTVLATCGERHGSVAPRLWLFPVSGGRVTALTAQRSGNSRDLGDVDAWKLTTGVYLQALGPCGVEFIATQSPNGSAHQVPIPGVHFPSDHIITGQGSSLLVQADNGCSGGASLVWFNTRTKNVTWVFHPAADIAGVQTAVPFGRPLS